MTFFDKFGVEFSDDLKTLVRCPKELQSEYIIPDKVTVIGGNAFEGCSKLTKIVIPQSVTSIGDWAFNECTSLISIAIPKSVTSISETAFGGCSSLESITVEDGNSKYDSRDNCNAIIETSSNTLKLGCKNTNIPKNITSIGDWAFQDSIGLISIIIPESVKSIGEAAFAGCSGLESIIVEAENPIYDSRNNCNAIIETLSNTLITGCKNTNIPDSVTIIGKGAFWRCTGITSLIIPDKVTRIEDYAFYYCKSLERVIIPDSVTFIGYGAFIWCSALTNIIIPDSVTSIEDSTFYACKTLTSITIHDNVTLIGKKAFAWCEGLTSVIIGCNVKNIGTEAFAWCKGLTSVIIGNKVKHIGIKAFDWCENLIKVTINSNSLVSKSHSYDSNLGNIFGSQVKEYILGDGVTKIGDYAFFAALGLVSVIISNKVKRIGDGAFDGCSNLANINIPISTTSIGEEAFYMCFNLSTLTLHSKIKDIGTRAFGWCERLTEINVAVDNKVYSSLDGVLFDKNQTVLIQYPCGKQGSYAIPDSVICIRDSAFSMCSGLTDIVIPDNVIIGHGVFHGCKCLTKVTIPSSITEVPGYTFGSCDRLANIIIPNRVESIGNYAFSICTNLTGITLTSRKPPRIEENTFWETDKSKCTLFVPEKSIKRYKTTEGWKDFHSIVKIFEWGKTEEKILQRMYKNDFSYGAIAKALGCRKQEVLNHLEQLGYLSYNPSTGKYKKQ